MRYRDWMLAGLCAQAGFAYGVGLGEMDVRSHLGAPLQAELDLLSAAQYDAQEIRVRIARSDVYDRLGARFEAFHNQIEFDVQRDASGQLNIRAFSKNRVVEPFLDIVVELSWPTGTTYRRYNLLLDPPAYAVRWHHQDKKSVTMPVEARAMAMAAKPPAKRPVATSSTIEPVSGTEYRVRSGDSLWKIARQLSAGHGGSVHEWMQALYLANPGAFIDGDRNRIKVGARLQWSTPTADYSQVATTPVPVTIPSRIQTTATPMAAHGGVNIQTELEQAQQAQLAKVPDSVADIQAAIARLQQEKVELQAFQQQLKTEMTAVLEQQVSATEAMLQAQQTQRKLVVEVPAEPEPLAAELPVAVNPAATVVPEQTAAEVQASLLHNDTAPATEALVDMRFRELMDAGRDVRTPDVSAVANQDLLAETPRLSNAVVSKGGSRLWYLLGLAPLGVLVVMMGMRSRRVAQIRQTDQVKDEDLHGMVFGSRRDRNRHESPEQIQHALSQIREKADLAERQRQEQQAAEALEARDDMKQMIDLYLVYSQYQKALNVILTEITKRPGRPDLRLYLMQVYAEMGDWKAFEEQEEVLQRLGQQQLLEKANFYRMKKA